MNIIGWEHLWVYEFSAHLVVPEKIDPDDQRGSQQSYFLPVEERAQFVAGTTSLIAIKLIPDSGIKDEKDFNRDNAGALHHSRKALLAK